MNIIVGIIIAWNKSIRKIQFENYNIATLKRTGNMKMHDGSSGFIEAEKINIALAIYT